MTTGPLDDTVDSRVVVSTIYTTYVGNEAATTADRDLAIQWAEAWTAQGDECHVEESSQVTTVRRVWPYDGAS